ncbi:MAG: hypothetical protein ACR2H6_13085 [Pyrinomonadaceae bacterium]
MGIIPEFRGDPITKELYRAVLNHGFSCLGLERIFGLAQPENLASSALSLNSASVFFARFWSMAFPSTICPSSDP